MIIVNTSTAIKTLKLTPRLGTILQAFLIDHISKIKTPLPFTTLTYNNNNVLVTAFFNTNLNTRVEEGKYYTLKLEDSNLKTLLYETIFCTNQTPSTYSINKSNYVSLNNDNNFIVYE